jgi:hypothetical protein
VHTVAQFAALAGEVLALLAIIGVGVGTVRYTLRMLRWLNTH